MIGRSPYTFIHCHADMCHAPGSGSSPQAADMLAIASVAVARPSLDDVFLTVTGRSLRDEPEA